MTSIRTSYRNVKRNIGNFFYTGKLREKHRFEKIFFPRDHKEDPNPEKYIKKEKRKEKVQRYAFIIGS